MSRLTNRVTPENGGPHYDDQAPYDEPENTEVDESELGHHRINLDNIETDAERQKTVQLLRGLPCPMKTKKKLLTKLLTQSTVKASGFVLMQQTKRKKVAQMANIWENILYTIALWGGNIRRIEGVHGSGVSSYFLFLRWLFGLNVFLFVLMFGLVTLPAFLLTESPLAASTVTAYNTSYYCNVNYTASIVTGTGVNVLLEWFQGSGWMENTLLYYGYYPVGLQEEYNISFAYIMTSILVLVTSLGLMAHYTSKSFKEALLNSAESNFEYSNKVFGAWDYGLVNENAAELKQKGILYDVQSDMIEQTFMRKRIQRLENGCSMCKLYTIRLLINFLIVSLLGCAAFLIYYTTTFSTSYVSENANATGDAGYLLLLVQFLPPIAITVCNAALPILFELLVKAEDYSQAFVIKITLIRTVFLRLASLIVLVMTLYSEITCGTTDSCRATQEPDCSSIKCWETYVGQQFYKLLVTDFLVGIIKVFLVEFPRRLANDKCKCGIFQKIGPPEFNIPANVLDLVYGQCLVWFGFLFSPMLPGMAMGKLFIFFYAKMFSVLKCCPPAERPYKASRINTFFMVILLMAYFLCALPVTFAIFGVTTSKGCGPFSVNTYMNQAIETTVAGWPSVLGSSYTFLTSTAVSGTIIILLIMTVYYLKTMSNAHREKADQFKEQLIMEGRDKQFLLTKLQDIYSGKDKKPDPAPQKTPQKKKVAPPKDNLTTVNEGKGGGGDDW